MYCVETYMFVNDLLIVHLCVYLYMYMYVCSIILSVHVMVFYCVCVCPSAEKTNVCIPSS